MVFKRRKTDIYTDSILVFPVLEATNICTIKCLFCIVRSADAYEDTIRNLSGLLHGDSAILMGTSRYKVQGLRVNRKGEK
jgi:hypothetical protein